MKPVFSLALILFAAFSCFAQEGEREISKEEFNRAFIKGLGTYGGKSYRETISWETVVKGKPTLSGPGKSIIEHIPGRSSSKAYYFSPQSKIKSSEIIQSGGVVYRRNNDEEWKKENFYTTEDDDNWNEKAGKEPPNKLILIEEQKVHKAFPTETQNDQKIFVLGFVRTTRYRYSGNNMEFTIAGHFKCWFAADGRLLKTESDTVETRQDGRITNTLRTTVYEFDPNIKIEIPVVKESN